MLTGLTWGPSTLLGADLKHLVYPAFAKICPSLDHLLLGCLLFFWATHFFLQGSRDLWLTFLSTLDLEYFFEQALRVLFLALSGESCLLSTFFSAFLSAFRGTLKREYFFGRFFEQFFKCSRARVLFWVLIWALKKVLSGSQLLYVKNVKTLRHDSISPKKLFWQDELLEERAKTELE